MESRLFKLPAAHCSLWKAALSAVPAEPYLTAFEVLLRAVAGNLPPATIACAAFFKEHVLNAAGDPTNERPALAAVRAVTPAFRQPLAPDFLL